ncbi:MAG: radical SAM protein [Clostridia bacterium]|nr:radical SAM protein [Clostridia bacterium]
MIKENIMRAVTGFVLDKTLKYVDKDPKKNIVKLINKAEFISGKTFPKKVFDSFRTAVQDNDNVWADYVMRILRDIDRENLKKAFLSFVLGAGYHGTKAVRKNREKYKCNIPFLMLLDPTSACNLRCKGCWSAEYGHKFNLSFEEMDSIVSQGVALGTHLYMFTGGEPLIRKNDILELCRKHKNCTFLAYTNATLIDQQFCEDMKEVGNLALAISIEGNEETNDFRRGEGAYETSIKALDLLKKNGCLYGISVCYTSKNIDEVTSDRFLDLMIEKGVKFGLYFNYMPVGTDAVAELIPTPEQRTYMYNWLRRVRNSKTGKPMFVMDFQNDGEYVGGCIAGGRNYIHINSAGDMEPCVFVHFSDSNIRTHTILEALQSPLFMAYYHNQPFNDNHLRPCPLLENPDCLRKIIAVTGAKSTDLVNQEGVEHLCAKCDKFAAEWAPVAQKLWDENKHPNPKTQYYRDTAEAMTEKVNDIIR